MADEFPLDVDALLSVLNHLSLGVYVTDRTRRILLWNRKAEEITGYSADAVVGRACHENVLVHVDKGGHQLCDSGLCPLFTCMNVGKESQSPVLVYAKTADGRRLPVSVSVAPLRDSSGNVVGGIEAFRDESEHIRDLELARKIQRRLLPDRLPQHGGLSFDARYYPHDLIGGDFYDVRDLGEGRFGVLVADVSGHGVSAALYTMWLKSLQEASDRSPLDPGGFLAGINHELHRFVVAESFATAVYALVDAPARRITYANAGHCRPIHFRNGGLEAQELGGEGVPLGILDEQQYKAVTFDLAPGDMALFYTDGVTEVMGRDGEMLGPNGLMDLVLRERAEGDKGLLERIYRRVREDVSAEVSLPDDFMLLSVTREDS